MSERTRRSVLAATGSVLALAGCLGDGDGGGGNDSAPADGTRLTGLRVANNDDRAHEVDVQIERNDTVVHWAGYELSERSAGEGSVVTIAPDWPDSPSGFSVEVQLDGERHRQFAVEGGCRNVFIEIDGEGALEKYTSDGNCGGSGNESAGADSA